MQEGIWKDIPDYEGLYQTSDLGNIKSLKYGKERILKAGKLNGYLKVVLSKNKKLKTFSVHQLVAMAFLNHKPCGTNLVVNHKNFNRSDNRVENLEIVTTRENTNLNHFKSSSKYVGVSWSKVNNKWVSRIQIKGRRKNLGHFINEIDAHSAYQNELNNLNNKLCQQ